MTENRWFGYENTLKILCMDKNFKQPFKIIFANFAPRHVFNRKSSWKCIAFINKNNSLTVSKNSALKRGRKYFWEFFIKIYIRSKTQYFIHNWYLNFNLEWLKIYRLMYSYLKRKKKKNRYIYSENLVAYPLLPRILVEG